MRVIVIGLLAASCAPTDAAIAPDELLSDALQQVDLVQSWATDGGSVQANYGWSVASAGDTNADGFDDLIVGSPLDERGDPAEGLAFLFLGGAGGPDTTPDWAVQSNQVGGEIGFAVDGAGDVNGDGFDDVIVGAAPFDAALDDAGQVYVYHGSPTGPSLVPDWTVSGAEMFGLLGYTVASAGDVNGDGFDDVIVGEHDGDSATDADAGKAYVYLGSAAGLDTTPAWIGEGEQTDSDYGDAVASAGDLNGDGFDDIVVGAPAMDAGQVDEGRAYVYLGSATGPSTTFAWRDEGNEAAAAYGTSVASAGDVNGDGVDDLIVGAPGVDKKHQDGGVAFLFAGRPIKGPAKKPTMAVGGDEAGGMFGFSVASAGDVDADGFDDVVVGAPDDDGPQVVSGKVSLFLGSAAGLVKTPAFTVQGNDAFGRFGQVVASAGDVDGNGLDDVLVGAPTFDKPQFDEGAAFLYLSQCGAGDTGCP